MGDGLSDSRSKPRSIVLNCQSYLILCACWTTTVNKSCARCLSEDHSNALLYHNLDSFAMASAVSVTYRLNPPPEAPVPAGLSSVKTHDFSIKGALSGSTDQKAYYEGLRAAVLQAKSIVGEELTAWRDTVGKREENKEARIPQREEDDEDEGEEVEEE